jgi:hypothetical protein
MKARRSWTDVILSLREHKYQPRLVYPAKLSITIDGETKVFHDKTKFHTLSFYESSPSKDNNRKKKTKKQKQKKQNKTKQKKKQKTKQEWKPRTRKSNKVILQQTKMKTATRTECQL